MQKQHQNTEHQKKTADAFTDQGIEQFGEGSRVVAPGDDLDAFGQLPRQFFDVGLHGFRDFHQVLFGDHADDFRRLTFAQIFEALFAETIGYGGDVAEPQQRAVGIGAQGQIEQFVALVRGTLGAQLKLAGGRLHQTSG